MDPDQFAAAGVQHDDLGDTATSADAGGDSGGSGDSWGRALLRRGWDLSRKAAIAGVAATAAPVVAPPLLVLSVAGIALSFPFAAYLASVFATERLMSALLPPPRTQPYHSWDLEDDEFLDAPEGPGGEDPVFDYWSETEDGAIMEMEEDESCASLPLSRECRLLEEPAPASSDDEDTMPEGEFRFQESGHESFVFDNTAQKEEDNEFITMEAPPPRAFDDSISAEQELCEEDDMVPRIKEAPVTADEPFQELSVSDNGDKTEDVKLKVTEEMESRKEMVSPDIGIDTTEVSAFPVPVDSTPQSKIEGDVAVEMLKEEVTIDTNPVTQVVGVQIEALVTEMPERESLHPSDPVTQESQMITVAAYVDDVLQSTVTEDIVMDIGDTNTEGMEHIDVGDVSSVVSMATVDDVAYLACSTSTPNILAISDDKVNVESRPDVDPSNQATGVEYTWTNKSAKTEERKNMDSKVSTRSMTPQEIDVSKSPGPDDQSKKEDVTVETVLEKVKNATDLDTGEVVGVQVDIVAIGSESLQLSDLVAQELQPVTGSATAESIQGSTVRGDIVMGTDDTSTESAEQHSEGGASSFISGASAVTMDDAEDVVSSRKPYGSAISEDIKSVEGEPDVEHPHETTIFGNKLTDEGLKRKVAAEDKSAKTGERKSMDSEVYTRSITTPQELDVSKSPGPDDKSKKEDEVTVETVLEEVTSTTDLVTGEVVGVQVDIVASESESLPLSNLVAQELQPVTEVTSVESIKGSTVRGDIVMDTDDTSTEAVEQHSEGGASSFMSAVSAVTMNDAEDIMFNRKPYVSAISEDIKSVKGKPDVEHPHQTTVFGNNLTDEGLKRKVVAEYKDNYTEEQLREQLDTLRTITGYRPVASLTLEAELAGLYIFVGVEPPVSSRDASDLTEINLKLQFLKSIIGVE